jgi:hypothetical protein
MKQCNSLGALALTLAWGWIAPLHAQTPVSKPQVWMMPPSAPDGAPNQYVIESWVGAPSVAVPETDERTFTRSVRDFSKRFAKEQR